MLVLTAIHDVMKISALLPTVLPAHAPFSNYQEGVTIHDHDAALGYVLTHDVDAMPSYAALPPEQRKLVSFTQAELAFNHGWLVQAALIAGFSMLPSTSTIALGHIRDIRYSYVSAVCTQ